MPDGLQTGDCRDRPTRPPATSILYVIGGHKVRNPAAAMALIERLA